MNKEEFKIELKPVTEIPQPIKASTEIYKTILAKFEVGASKQSEIISTGRSPATILTAFKKIIEDTKSKVTVVKRLNKVFLTK